MGTMVDRQPSSGRVVQPPAFFLGALLLGVVLHFALPLWTLLALPWRLLGVLPIAAGAALNLQADAALKKQRTTVKSHMLSSVLIKDGVFGLSRNPMYLGMLLILAGEALCLGSLGPWLAPLALLPVLVYRYIKPEEEMLLDTFGDEYRRYMARVRRWI